MGTAMELGAPPVLQAMSQEKMPMLIETIKKVRTRHTTMVDFAVMNGIEETKKRGNRKRGNKVE